jgi:hypothetical protein
MITSNHNVTHPWVEEHGGRHTSVKGTSNGGIDVLRIIFPGYGSEVL